MSMLIEVIYKGSFSTVDFRFLKYLLTDAREVRFDFPEIDGVNTFDEIIQIINSNAYIDLVINTDKLNMDGRIIPHVFINIGRDAEAVEYFFFFNLEDIREDGPKKNLDYVRRWMEEIQHKYNFQYFICQFDNADKEEYYFDSNGLGKLYEQPNYPYPAHDNE